MLQDALAPFGAKRQPLTTITGAQRASGQTHSRARSHQDGADLCADRSTAYLVSCIRVRSAHGNSLLLAIVGLAVLIYPLIGSSDVLGLMLALATATSWAAGTVYLKWAQIDADPMAISAWQLFVGLLVTVAGMLIFEGSLHLWPVHPRALWALFFSAVVGSAFAYLLWFEIVRRLPATTASLGVLSVPVVGILSSVLILGERHLRQALAVYAAHDQGDR